MLGIIISWLGSIDQRFAPGIARALFEMAVKKEEVSRPKAEA